MNNGNNHQNRDEKRFWKCGLMMQSLAPLFLLIIIKNFNFDLSSKIPIEFISNNLWLLLVMLISVVWLLLSVFIYIVYKFYHTSDFGEGYTIKNVEKINDEGLGFFLTYVLPISIDELNNWQNVLAFSIILVIIIILMYKTNLYFSNPILIILGYSVIRFQFKNPPNDNYKGTLIGICPCRIKEDKSIKYKLIADNVFCVKQKGENYDERRNE